MGSTSLIAVASSGGQVSMNMMKDAQEISAVAAWNQSKKIYEINPTLKFKNYAQVKAPKTTDFSALTNYCLYIKLPEPWENLLVFYAYLEQDMNGINQQELRLFLEYDNNEYRSFPIHLNKATLREAVGSAYDFASMQGGEIHKKCLIPTKPFTKMQD